MISRRQFLLSAPLLSLAGCSRKADEEPLWIGHVAPLSGPERAAGEHARNGILLAVEEINAALGAKERRVAVLHADSRGQLDPARQEAIRLATLNKVLALLGGRDQDGADRLGQALSPYPTALLTPASHNSASLEGVFSLGVPPEFRGNCLARFAVEKHSTRLKAIAVVDDTVPACTSAAAGFLQHWRSEKGRSAETWDLRGDRAAAKVGDRLSKHAADVLLFAGKAADFLALGKLSLPVLFAGEEMEWRRLERELQATSDLHTATVYVPDRFDDDGKEFLKKYQERHHEKADADAWQGYEMTRVAATALRQSKGTGAIGLRERLQKSEELPGLTGTLKFKDGAAVRPLFIVGRGSNTAVQEFKREG